LGNPFTKGFPKIRVLWYIGVFLGNLSVERIPPNPSKDFDCVGTPVAVSFPHTWLPCLRRNWSRFRLVEGRVSVALLNHLNRSPGKDQRMEIRLVSRRRSRRAVCALLETICSAEDRIGLSRTIRVSAATSPAHDF